MDQGKPLEVGGEKPKGKGTEQSKSEEGKVMADRTYHLQYKMGYKHGGTYHSPMWKYQVFTVRASSLKAAKAKVKRNHPKATMLEYLRQAIYTLGLRESTTICCAFVK